MKYKAVQHKSIDVFYLDELDGGGNYFGQDYIRFVSEHIGKVDRVFEWCAGPGFIGFSLLASNLCNTLCLADINPKAVDVCKETIMKNHLEDRASLYLSDCLDSIPEYESFDLVVGNPPHSNTSTIHQFPRLLYMDNNWKIHQRFYQNITRFMRPSASVIIQENCNDSSIDSFQQMINQGGMRVIDVSPCQTDSRMYYIWSSLQNQTIELPSLNETRSSSK